MTGRFAPPMNAPLVIASKLFQPFVESTVKPVVTLVRKKVLGGCVISGMPNAS